MPTSSRETVLCRYHYDPLDRQYGCTLLQQPALQRFYCESRLATEIQGAVRWSIVQHDNQLLAQQQSRNGQFDTVLLATDQQRSVLNALDATQPNPLAYSPYGHRPAENGLLSLLGFNGEQPDAVTGHYHLGNGYRQFNPVLMRFNSPDSWSPFGEGGLNAYAYCGGDPRNRVDPTGHVWKLKSLKRLFGLGPKKAKSTNPVSKTIASRSPKTPTTGEAQLPKKTVTYLEPEDDFHNLDLSFFEQVHTGSNRRNYSISLKPPEKKTSIPKKRTSISSYSNVDMYPSYPLAQNQYDNFLNNALGSSTTAPLHELLENHTWLNETAGPSRLADKTDYTRDKIRQNIERHLNTRD